MPALGLVVEAGSQEVMMERLTEQVAIVKAEIVEWATIEGKGHGRGHYGDAEPTRCGSFPATA